ncbi:MAG: 16S rRNA (adenine(1518)-N(6)/adenine(1519)-N(6))-dimethyltransferase RsmA [Candidatus Binatia bacterium]
MSLHQEARAACRELGFKPRRALGQHFLVHERVIEAILRLIDLSQEDEVLEVGPGMGFLTRRLVGVARMVHAIEVDPLLIQWLRKGPLGSHPSLDLVHGDIMEVPLGSMLPDHKVKVVANLPYGISTPVLFRLFEERDRFSLLVLMVQQEVAERMAASPGTKSYGTLSVWCQIHGQILARVSVAPDAFFPRPKVRSTVLKIGLYSKPLIAPEDFSSLRALVRVSFGQRRKMLSNALRSLLDKGRDEIEAFLGQEGIDPRRRGETLSLDEFIRLARALRKS